MNCVSCKGVKKYKCSKCRAPYCSVACYQEHKELCEGKARTVEAQRVISNEEPIVKTDYLSDEELRIAPQQLYKLGKDQRVKEMLKNPLLRQKLLSIDNSKQRMTEVVDSMRSQDFHQFFQLVMGVMFDQQQ